MAEASVAITLWFNFSLSFSCFPLSFKGVTANRTSDILNEYLSIQEYIRGRTQSLGTSSVFPLTLRKRITSSPWFQVLRHGSYPPLQPHPSRTFSSHAMIQPYWTTCAEFVKYWRLMFSQKDHLCSLWAFTLAITSSSLPHTNLAIIYHPFKAEP